MKKLVLLFVFMASYQLYCQSANYNLSGLKSVKLELIDPSKAMNAQTTQKLLSECKVKLASLGIEVKENNATAALQFKIDISTSGTLFTTTKALLRLELLEKVQTFRDKSPRTEAKTYNGILLETISSRDINNECYSLFMDKLFLGFLDNWVKDNKTAL